MFSSPSSNQELVTEETQQSSNLSRLMIMVDVVGQLLRWTRTDPTLVSMLLEHGFVGCIGQTILPLDIGGFLCVWVFLFLHFLPRRMTNV